MPVESGVDMRKTIAIEIVLMRYFWFLLVCVTAMGETIPCYSPVFFTPERRAAVRKNLEEKIPVAGEELAGLKRKFLSLESNDRHFRNRMTYRFELADRLLQQIEEELQTGTTDSVMFARRRFADLLMFRDYFEDELALVVANQRKENLKVLSVKEFGAVGDGVQDDSPAFEQALREFDGHAGFGKLTIPAGSYRLSSGGKPYHLLLKGLRNLEIVGEPETTLIFSDVGARGLELDSCRNVAVRNLILRYADPPFVQGRIEKVEFDGGGILFRRDAGFDDPIDRACCVVFDPDSNRVVQSASPKFTGKTEALGEGLYRMSIVRSFQKSPLDGLREGQIFVIPERVHQARAVSMTNAEYCTMENITVQNSPSVGWFVVGSASTGNNFVGCVIAPAPGMAMSTCADGLHTSTQRIAPYLAECVFSGMGDDCVNIKISGDYLHDSTAETLSSPIAATFRQGTELSPPPAVSVFDSRTGTVVFESALLRRDGIVMKLADTPPDLLRSFASLKQSVTAEQSRAVEMGLKRLQNSADVVLYPSRSIGAVIVGCTFVNNRNKGIIIQAPDAVVAGNRIADKTCGIRVGCSFPWREGIPPYNVILRDNRLENCISAIRVNCDFITGKPVKITPIRSIELAGNRILGSELLLDNIHDLNMRGNFLEKSRVDLRTLKRIRQAENAADGNPLILPAKTE